jgi:hypothetical protein
MGGLIQACTTLGAMQSENIQVFHPLGQDLSRCTPGAEERLGSGCAGAKGSDVSAREATRKMVAARRQLVSLHRILTAIPGAVPSKELSAAAAEAHEGLAHAPRNTIVRDVLKNLHR